MSSTNNSSPTARQSTHQDFRWIHGAGQHEPLANFVELTRDITAGINTCLQIIFAGNLERMANEDTDPDGDSPPAISKTDADNLLRLSMAASSLLRDASDKHIDRLNGLPADF